MAELAIEPVVDAALPAMHALNTEHEALLSPLSLVELGDLVARCSFARQAAGGRAFLLALDHGADHSGTNFRWFVDRYPSFLYVDRVAVHGDLRRHGLARRFYEALEAHARERGLAALCAEINAAPENPASHAFHQRFGFETVGSATLAGGKTVEYYLKSLD